MRRRVTIGEVTMWLLLAVAVGLVVGLAWRSEVGCLLAAAVAVYPLWDRGILGQDGAPDTGPPYEQYLRGIEEEW